MPYDWSTGTRRYYDPIKISESRGLDRVVREPMTFWMKNSGVDKYDIFAEYPFLERIDYNRLLFEVPRKLNGRDWREGLPYCCYPVGCVLCSAMGCVSHWKWRAAFEKQLPYWPIRDTHIR